MTGKSCQLLSNITFDTNRINISDLYWNNIFTKNIYPCSLVLINCIFHFFSVDWRSLDTCRGATASTFSTQALGTLRYVQVLSFMLFHPSQKKNFFYTDMYHHLHGTSSHLWEVDQIHKSENGESIWIFNLILYFKGNRKSYSDGLPLYDNFVKSRNPRTLRQVCFTCPWRKVYIF